MWGLLPRTRAEKESIFPSGERAMVGSVGIDDPEIRIALVGHGIVEAAHVDDALSVGRDLRVGGELQLELVHGVKFVRSILRPEGRAWRKCQSCSHHGSGDARFGCHGKGPPRGASKQRERRYVKVMGAAKWMGLEGFVDTFACASLD